MRRLLRALVDDPFTKIGALLIAFSMWLWVQYQETDRALVRVNVDYTLPDGLVPLDGLAPSTIAVVEGPRVALRRARNEQPWIRLDLTDETVGPVDRVLDPAQVEGLPAGVRMVGLNPEQVRVTLDERTKRRVTVLAHLVGRVAEHHTVGRTTLQPEVVEIQGARSLVDGIDALRTMPVDVSGLTADTQLPVQLDLPRGIRAVEPWDGVATVNVESQLAVKRLDDVEVIVRNEGWAAAAGFERISVQLQGPSVAVRAIPNGEVIALVELPPGADEDAYTAMYEADAPPRYRLVYPRQDVVIVAGTPPPLQVVRR